MSAKDQVFAESFSQIKAFEFDEKVVAVFPDMIKRSVPGYDTILKGVAMLAMKYVKPDTSVFDLGASLGAVSLTIDQAVGSHSIKIYAVDNSAPMMNALQHSLSQIETNNQIISQLDDIQNTDISDASMVVSNFTLQFIPVKHRMMLCESIYAGLNVGGVFVLSEKIKSSDLMIDYYHGYKKINGYSDMEVAQKRQALEESLKPDSLQVWQQRLEAAGFKQVEVWFKAFNFVSLVAIK